MGQFNVDDKIVKKPQDEVPLTEEEVQEWIKCAQDKFYFFENYCYVQGQSGRVLFKARPYQKRIMDTCEDNRFVIALSGRQSGKCCLADTKVLTRLNISDTVIEGEFDLEFIHMLTNIETPDEALKLVYDYLRKGERIYENHCQHD